MLNNGKSIVFKIEGFDVSIQDDIVSQNDYSLSDRRAALSRETFKLRLFDGENDVTYFIAKKDSIGNFNTLRKALQYIYGDNASFNQTFNRGKRIDYIYSINNKLSNLNPNINPRDYTKENLSQGFWFKLIKDGTSYAGGLDDPLNELNIDITLVYLTGNDLYPRKPKVYSVIATNTFDLIDNSAVPTKLFASKGDRIELNITPYISEYTQEYVNERIQFIDMPYSRNIISEKWKFQKLSKYDVLDLNLYIKFEGIEEPFKISELKDLKITFNPPNSWRLEFETPEVIRKNVQYEISLSSEENSFLSMPIQLNSGIIQSDYESILTYINSRKNSNNCWMEMGFNRGNICDFVDKLLRENFYRTVIKYQKSKFTIQAKLLR